MTDDDPIADDELAELVGRTAEAAAAYMRGDIDTYLELSTSRRTSGATRSSWR